MEKLTKIMRDVERATGRRIIEPQTTQFSDGQIKDINDLANLMGMGDISSKFGK